MSNKNEILELIKELYGCKKLLDIASVLEINMNTFYDIKKKIDEEEKLKTQIDIELDSKKRDQLIKKLEDRRRRPNVLFESIIKLAEKDCLNLNWLFYGKPPIYVNEKKVAKIVQKQHLADFQSDDLVSVPYFANIKASAGNGYINYDDEDQDYLILPKQIVNTKKAHALRVDGNSMSPNIRENSIIIVDLNQTDIINNNVYVVRFEDEIYVKRLELVDDNVLLRSDNMEYKTIVVPRARLSIIGKVLNTIQNENID